MNSKATTKTPLDAFTFRSFRKDDYLGLAGAERFADGTEPMISTGERDGVGEVAFMVVDANGLNCFINGDEEKQEDAFEMRLDLEGMHKDFILAIAGSIRRDVTPAQLSVHGFKATI